MFPSRYDAPQPSGQEQRSITRERHKRQLVAMLDKLSNTLAGGQRADPRTYLPIGQSAIVEPEMANLGGIEDDFVPQETEIDTEAVEGSGLEAPSGSDLVSAEGLPSSAELKSSQKGLRNGYIPNDRLAAISGANPGGGQGYILDVAAPAWEAMRRAAAADGVRLYYTSTYRSYATQKAAYDKYKAGGRGKGVIVAPPGRSKHGAGLAIDISDGTGIIGKGTVQWQWLVKNAARFGWYPISSESWHWEYRGT